MTPSVAPLVAIVTGAGSARGIGFASAVRLGVAGMQIVVTSTTDRIFDRVDELRARGIAAHGVVADLTAPGGAERVRDGAESSFGAVSVLVNNAGMTSVSDPNTAGVIDRISTGAWAAALDRNLTSSFLMTRSVIPAMKQARFGRIVTVSSVSGPVQAYAGDVAYHAAKAALVGLTRALAIDVAGFGITANAVAPGWIDSASATEHERAMGHATPLGRPGTPDEIAAVIAFLATADASYLTGQLITIDGANSINEERGFPPRREEPGATGQL